MNDRADTIVAAAKAENRDLTAAEARELDTIFEDFATMREAELSLGRRTASEPVASAAPAPTRFADAPAMPRGVVGKKSCRDIFGAARGDSGGFANFGDFIRTVGNGLHHPGLRTISADWNEGTGESGGYFVPEQLAFGLYNAILEHSIVLSGAEVFPMQSNILTVPHFDYGDHRSIGGFAFEWLGELQPATEQEGTLKALSLRAKKLAIYTSASIELITDAGPAFSQKLEAAMADSAAFGIDHTRHWCTNRRCWRAGREGSDVRRFQVTRAETGMPSCVIRLITAQPIRASAFCPGRLQARRRRPINVL